MMEDDTHTIPTASDQLLHSFWIPTSSPSFHGTASASASASMVNFENRRLEDEELDQKKRRLTAEQVEFLEKSFDVENKLEPHRKTQLAKQLGLQPRQVAIWFQNRRARYKTKLLEKQYDSLKSCYDKLKEDYDALFSDNQKLKNELVNLQKDGCEACSSGRSDVLESDSSGVLENDEDERLCLPKLEPLHPNSCNLGFPAQNQGTWFWQY